VAPLHHQTCSFSLRTLSPVADDFTATTLARFWSPQNRASLVVHAAKYVHRNRNRVLLGIDAEILVDEAIKIVLDAGLPENTDEPIAHLKTIISRRGINQIRRRKMHGAKTTRIQHLYGGHAPDTADLGTAQLSLESQRREFEKALRPHRPPIPQIILAKRDNPTLTNAEIAEMTNTSERAVYRALDAIRHDEVFRSLLSKIAASNSHLAAPAPTSEK